MLKLPPNAMLDRARSALAAHQLIFAEQACRSVIKAMPDRVDAWLLLARVLLVWPRPGDAETVIQECERLKAPAVETLKMRIEVRWRQGRDEDVKRLCRELLNRDPFSSEAKVYLAGAERRSGHPEVAVRVIQDMPRHPAAAFIAAQSYLDMGDLAGAVRVSDPFVDRADMNQGDRSNLFHARGLAFEGLERYDDAIKCYAEAKAFVPLAFDIAAFKSSLALVREVFSKELLQNGPKPTVRSSRPVFIAGMPRSGTTLLDRIIAAHPSGGGAGETRALRGQVTEWVNRDLEKSFPKVARHFTTEDLDRIATRYLHETDVHGKNALRIADKHLQNWSALGLISMVFPDARVIHVKRDPLDVGISCFERLQVQAIPWSADLKQIGIAMRGCELLMNHWHEVLPNPILVVEYENLVRNQEAETRRILEFLELPWSDACLDYHTVQKPESERALLTLSSEQTNKPIYDRAIGRGARFGAAMEPLREGLAEQF